MHATLAENSLVAVIAKMFNLFVVDFQIRCQIASMKLSGFCMRYIIHSENVISEEVCYHCAAE